MDRRLGLAGLVLLAAGLSGLAGCVDQNGSSPLTGDAGPLLEASTGDSASPPSVTLGASPVIDFGLIACGAPAPAAQTFTIANTGPVSVSYGLSLSATSAFQIVGPTSGNVAPGANATVTIGVAAEPTSATAGAVDQATLTVTTDDPNHPSTAVTLKRTAQGATLTLASPASFPDTPVGATSQPLALTLTNTGNLAASITLGAPSDPQFALTMNGVIIGAQVAIPPVTLAPSAAVPSLSATFAPTASGPASASSPLTVSGAVCGLSASSIAYSGNGTKGVVGVSPATLPFGSVDCGGKAAAPQTVTINNTGNASFDYTATLLLGAASPFTVSAGADAGAGATGSVAAGSSATLTVTPLKIPAVASVAANAFGDTLRITSDAVGDADHDVTLTESAQGAVLSLTTSAIGFNDVVLQQTATMPFTISNSGNLPSTVTLVGSGAPFGVAPATATQLTVGGSPLNGTASYKPTTLGGASGSITISTGATDVYCSAPIGPINLTGTGVNGVMAVSTGALDFLSVPCGTQTAAQTFTINNTGTAPFTWAATLGKNPSPYTVSPSNGTQNPGAPPTTVTVTPQPIPFPSAVTANLYGDTITITPTGISGGAAKTVTLTETAQGAIITASPSPFPSFNNQQEGQPSAAATLTLTNTGNVPVTITPTIGGANPTSFSLATPGAKALAANGGTYSPGPTFDPLALGPLSAQVTLTSAAGDVLCQPLPGPVALGGTGTNGAITVGAAALTFTNQACGAGAGMTQTVKLTNNGTAPLTFNASILGTSGFQVAPPSGPLAAGGGNTLLTVTSPTFATTLGNVNAVTDTLQVTTTAYQDISHPVSLSSTPSGAILAWGGAAAPLAFNTVQATSNASVSPQQSFSIVNNGSLTASVSFATQTAGAYTAAPSGSTPLAGGGAKLDGTVNFTPIASGLQSNALEASVAVGTPLCAPLPAGLGLSGTGAQGTYSNVLTGMAFPLTCNAAAVPQSFSINNVGALAPSIEPYDFTTSIGAGWSVSPPNGTVSPNTPVTITVTPPTEGFAAAGTNDVQVTVTTDIPGDAPHSYAVDGTITGAQLSFMSLAGGPQPTLAFNDNNAGTTTLQNSGNSAPTVDIKVVANPANPDYPSTAGLLINGVEADTSTLTATVGATGISYTTNVSGTCDLIYIYTVTIPDTSIAGVCAAATQTLTITHGGGC